MKIRWSTDWRAGYWSKRTSPGSGAAPILIQTPGEEAPRLPTNPKRARRCAQLEQRPTRRRVATDRDLTARYQSFPSRMSSKRSTSQLHILWSMVKMVPERHKDKRRRESATETHSWRVLRNKKDKVHCNNWFRGSEIVSFRFCFFLFFFNATQKFLQCIFGACIVFSEGSLSITAPFSPIVVCKAEEIIAAWIIFHLRMEKLKFGAELKPKPRQNTLEKSRNRMRRMDLRP